MENRENIQHKSVINWYPGHMEKARRQMQENLKLVDLVIELRDARAPLASANPLIERLIGEKKRLLVLTKKDMADPIVLDKWLAYFKTQGIYVLAVDAGHDDLKRLIPKVAKEICKDKLERAKARGIRKKVLRAMVCGIPNVGKSTFINAIVKKRVAKVENRPGVTRSLTWIKLDEDLELLDTPGVLWPKFEDQDAAKKLVLIGSIKDEVVDKDSVVDHALDILRVYYPDTLKERYHISVIDEDDRILLKDISKAMNFYKSGDEVDILRTQDFILSDIRNDNLKAISLERPDE